MEEDKEATGIRKEVESRSQWHCWLRHCMEKKALRIKNHLVTDRTDLDMQITGTFRNIGLKCSTPERERI